MVATHPHHCASIGNTHDVYRITPFVGHCMDGVDRRRNVGAKPRARKVCLG